MTARLTLLLGMLLCLPARSWDVKAPRGPTRHIDYSVTEGTIQSLDASPDGQWIVFDLLAHVYRVPSGGGEAECLTQDSGIALNFDPRYSPDGRHIAFTSDRNGQNSLWMMDADGGNPRIVADGGEYWITQADWAPDGRSLVATKYLIHRLPSGDWTLSSQIWRFPLDGGEPARLTAPGLSYVVAPAYSPDGRFVYYQEMSQPAMAHDMFLVSDGHHIRRVDLATGRTEAVTESGATRPYGFAAAPQLSPDGRTLSFVRRVPGRSMSHRGQSHANATGLWLRDLETGRERLLHAPLHPDHFDTSDGYHLRFTPGYAFTDGGRSIVFTEGGQIRRIDIETANLATVPFTARVQRNISAMARPTLAVDPPGPPVRFARRATSSPEGSMVLFDALGTVWVTAPDGGAPVPLVAEAQGAVQFAPTWSADGRWIAWISGQDGVGGHVWIRAAAGGAARRVTAAPGEYLGVAFTLDGRELVTLRGGGATARGLTVRQNAEFLLERMPVDGGVPRRVARFTQQPSPPAIGPAGRVYFTEQVADYDGTQAGPEFDEFQPRMALVSLDLHGLDRREHARFPFTSHARIAPDGRFVAFEEAGNVLLAPLSAGAVTPPFLDRSDESGPVRWLTRRGGHDARWMDATRLEYLNGDRYFRVDLATGAVESRPLSLHIVHAPALGRIAFTDARILTMKGREIIERGALVVEDGRIACVGECSLAGARLVDARGKTLMPGLMDVHAHPDYDDDPMRLHQPQLGLYTAYGVTTILDPSAGASRVFPTAELVAARRPAAPRILSAGPAVTPTGDVRRIGNLEDAVDDVERLAAAGALAIKQYTLRRRDQRQWLVEASRRNGRVLVTSERLNLYFDLGTVMDGQTGIEHPLTEHPVYSDVIHFLAAAGVNHTPALQAPGQGYYAQEYWQARTALRHDAKFMSLVPWREQARFAGDRLRPVNEYPILFWTQTAKDLLHAGGSVSAGAHSKWDGVGVHWELWTLALAISPMEALETATILPARYLGVAQDLGSLEPGKIADIVVLNSNPLDDIRNTADIACVMQAGVLYDDDTLDRLWPEPATYGPRPWLLEQPAPGIARCHPRPTVRRPDTDTVTNLPPWTDEWLPHLPPRALLRTST